MIRRLIVVLAGLLTAIWPVPAVVPPATPETAMTRVEVVGDLAAADRIAVIVPGVGTTAESFGAGLGGVARRSPSWQAGRLYAAALTGGHKVAVVAWLGYRPPAGAGVDAARSERAEDGARALTRFVRRLPRGAAVVLIGHSYGSLVVAYAARDLPPSVTDLVMLGSPGLDVADADDLGGRATVWAAEAPDDWIRWLPEVRVLGFGHGPRPTRPGFAARRLDTARTSGHDGYFVPGSGSLEDLAAVLAGDRPYRADSSARSEACRADHCRRDAYPVSPARRDRDLGAVLRNPVSLVSPLNPDGTPNLAPISSSWYLGRSVVLGLGRHGQTLANLERRSECVVNLPSADLQPAVERLAPLTGRTPVPEHKRVQYRYEPRKFDAASLTPQPSVLVGPPRVRECPVQLEARCHVVHRSDDDGFAVVRADVVRIHVDERLVLPGTHYVDLDRWRPLFYVVRHCFGLGDGLGRNFRAEYL